MGSPTLDVEQGRIGPVEWAAVSLPFADEPCGDRHIATPIGDTAVLFGVLDGLGHGHNAAVAALHGVTELRRAPEQPFGVLIELCHHALLRTRGVAMTLARIDFDPPVLSCTGIGNVTASLVARSPGGIDTRYSALPGRGIVGYNLPPIFRTDATPMHFGDLLVMATDGIHPNHLDGIDFAAPLALTAEQILSQHRKTTDDALVLVARHRSPKPLDIEKT